MLRLPVVLRSSCLLPLNKGVQGPAATRPGAFFLGAKHMNAPTMRAKFQVASVTKHEGGNETVKFSAVAKSGAYPADGKDDDNTYARFSPSASCEITIANPALHGKLVAGQKYYVDFTEAT